jgi:hypothetical protein
MRIQGIICMSTIILSACGAGGTRDEGGPAVECGSADDDQDSGVFGCWALDTAVASEEGLLIIRSDGSPGHARLYFFLGESLYYALFDVQVLAQFGRESGTVELAFECLAGEQDPCAELDFTLSCPYAGDVMGPCFSPVGRAWAGYPFNWTRCHAPDCPKPPT